jgi:hypothetical protein
MPTAAVTTFHGNVETVRDRAGRALRATQTGVSKYEAIRPQLHRARPNERGNRSRGPLAGKSVFSWIESASNLVCFARDSIDVDGVGEQIRAADTYYTV